MATLDPEDPFPMNRSEYLDFYRARKPATLPDNASVAVAESGEYPLDTETVLKALSKDPRNEAERELATTQLKVWRAIKRLLPPGQEDDIGLCLLNASFSNWRNHGLTQLAAALAQSIGGEVSKMASMDKPVKLLVIGGETQPAPPDAQLSEPPDARIDALPDSSLTEPPNPATVEVCSSSSSSP